MFPVLFFFITLDPHAPVNSFTRMITVFEHDDMSHMADESREINMALINNRSKLTFSTKLLLSKFLKPDEVLMMLLMNISDLHPVCL